VEAGAQDLDVDVDLNLLPIPGKINRKLPLKGGVSQQGMSTHFFRPPKHTEKYIEH